MPRSLAELQRAFHAIATGAAPLDDADGLVCVDGVAPAERMAVYAHAYAVRLRDAIAAEMPKLATLHGADFAHLAARYLAACPPASPTLRDAAARLPGFLAAAGLPRDADLAALERARTEAFDGPEAAPLTRDDLAALPPEAFVELRLALVPTAALVPLSTNADDAWAALEGEAPVPAPATVRRTVLVWRRDAIVVHRTVPPDEAAALTALAGPDGATFAAVCEALATAEPGSLDETALAARALDRVLGWLDAAVIRSPASWRASSISTHGPTAAASSAPSTPARRSC